MMVLVLLRGSSRPPAHLESCKHDMMTGPAERTADSPNKRSWERDCMTPFCFITHIRSTTMQ